LRNKNAITLSDKYSICYFNKIRIIGQGVKNEIKLKYVVYISVKALHFPNFSIETKKGKTHIHEVHSRMNMRLQAKRQIRSPPGQQMECKLPVFLASFKDQKLQELATLSPDLLVVSTTPLYICGHASISASSGKVKEKL